MPSYEASFLLKKLGKSEVANVLKRLALQILGNNGILFGIENLGSRALPYRMKSHGTRYQEGSYFLMKFDSSPTAIPILKDEFQRDIDIIRAGFVRINPESRYKCTLEEEMKPPAYRKHVQAMVEEGRKRERIFGMKTGLAYNPWNR